MASDGATLPGMNVPPEAREGVWLTVEFYIREEKLAEAEALFRQHVADGRRDRGNLVFVMMRHAEQPHRFKSIECWGSQADVDNHDAQAHHPVFLSKLREIESRPKLVMAYDFFADGERQR